MAEWPLKWMGRGGFNSGAKDKILVPKIKFRRQRVNIAVAALTSCIFINSKIKCCTKPVSLKF